MLRAMLVVVGSMRQLLQRSSLSGPPPISEVRVVRAIRLCAGQA